MATSFATPASKRLLLAGLFVTAAVLILQAGKVWYADGLIGTATPAKMERGTALLPGNADSWDRLGRYYFLDFENPDPSRAIADYRKAVEIDPRSAHYWMDLANACESVGDVAGARDAYQHAEQVYPSSAEVAWNVGSFLLRQNDSRGYEEIQRAVRGDTTLLPLAISRVWRSSEDADQLLNVVVPPNAPSLLVALDFFASNQNTKAALIVWQHLMALHEPFPLHPVFSFLDQLVRDDDSKDAGRVWRDALAASGNAELEPIAANLISDGIFAGDFPDGGLGWRWDSAPGAAIDFSAAPPAVRGRSIRLTFSGGTNLQLDQPSQFVAVEPSTHYRFHALMRTEGITTDSGLRFILSDPHHSGAPTLLTDNLTASHPWTNIDADFTTSPQTEFVVVALHRDPSRFFDNKLGGTVWIANISLSETVAPVSRP